MVQLLHHCIIGAFRHRRVFFEIIASARHVYFPFFLVFIRLTSFLTNWSVRSSQDTVSHPLSFMGTGNRALSHSNISFSSGSPSLPGTNWNREKAWGYEYPKHKDPDVNPHNLCARL